MVGIENDENKELEGATFNPESLNNLFENLLLTLSQLSTDTAHQNTSENQERGQRTGTASLQSFRAEERTDLDSDPNNPAATNTMTILPKKKAHKERNEQRDHRHHGTASSQAAGYSHAEFGPESARMGHSEIDHRAGNLSELGLLHVHHHASGFQQPVPHSFPEIPSSEPYRQPLSERTSASSSSLAGRHDRSIGSRKERSASQFELEAACHAKKRCLSPGFQDKSYPSSSQHGTNPNCGHTHPGLYSSSNALMPGSSQEEPTNSDDNNSEDEYYGNITRKTLEDEEKFAKMIEKKGWCIKQMASDGACLFRAVADQVYGDQEMHDEVRTNCLNYMSKNEEHFSQYVTEDFAKYLTRKRNVHCHGNHLEIQALAEVYNRPIEIYYYDIEPRNVFHGEYKTDYPPIRLSYHGNVHYNSVREPYSATVGIGLGLPEFQPGLAEKQLLSEAMKRSEENQIEDAMLKDKMKDSDWDVMQAQIEEQIAEESYREWMNGGYGGAANSAGAGKRSPRQQQQQQQQHSPPAGSSPDGAAAIAAAVAAAAATEPAAAPLPAAAHPSLVDFLPPEMSDWDENAILAHALAESTLHYYETLKSGSGSDAGASGGGSIGRGAYDTGKPGCSKHT